MLREAWTELEGILPKNEAKDKLEELSLYLIQRNL
jgi:hypothetical protein